MLSEDSVSILSSNPALPQLVDIVLVLQYKVILTFYNLYSLSVYIYIQYCDMRDFLNPVKYIHQIITMLLLQISILYWLQDRERTVKTIRSLTYKLLYQLASSRRNLTVKTEVLCNYFYWFYPRNKTNIYQLFPLFNPTLEFILYNGQYYNRSNTMLWVIFISL